MRTFFASLILFTWPGLLAAEFKPFAGANPLVVFIQTDPWLGVIGSDTPRVAFYENGDLIFLQTSNHVWTYRYKKLSEEEKATFMEHFKALGNLKPAYNILPSLTDQPEALFYFHSGEKEITTRVYGLRTRDAALGPAASVPTSKKADDLPTELVEAHGFLSSLDITNSTEWKPQYIEVMLWSDSFIFGRSWPKKWPGLNSERAIRRGDSYSIFLDGDQLSELNAFAAKKKGSRTVRIG